MEKKDLGKIALGVAIGAAGGVLLAPKSGKETREDLKNKMAELSEKVKNFDSKKAKAKFDKKIKELERELKALDKEKVLKIAKEKATNIKNQAENLLKMAKEEGNKAIVKTCEEIREKAIEVTKNILAKLENEA